MFKFFFLVIKHQQIQVAIDASGNVTFHWSLQRDSNVDALSINLSYDQLKIF